MDVHGLIILGNTHNTTQHNITQGGGKRKKKIKGKNTVIVAGLKSPTLRGLTMLKENLGSFNIITNLYY